MNASRTFSPARASSARETLEAIFKRVGWVILACAAARLAWPLLLGKLTGNDVLTIKLSLPILDALVGILLLSVRLRLASFIRWILVFGLSASLVFELLELFVTPVDLQLARLRFSPIETIGSALFSLAGFAVRYWIVLQLGRPTIHLARAAQGRPFRNMQIPIVLGVACALVSSVFYCLTIFGEDAQNAKAQALQQVGPDYNFHVKSLASSKKNRRAEVVAWNDSEMKSLQVEWSR